MFLSFNARIHYVTAAGFLVTREPDGCVMFWGLCFLGEWDTAWNSCLQRSTLPASFVGLGCLPFFFSVCLTVCFYAAVVILHPVSRSHNNSKKKKKFWALSANLQHAMTYNTISCQASVLWVKGTVMDLSLPDTVCLVNMNVSEPAWHSVLREYEWISAWCSVLSEHEWTWGFSWYST